MANLRLTDRQEKSTFSNEDYIHVVSGGTSFKQKLSALSSEFGQTAGSTTGTIVYTGAGLSYEVSSSSQYINSTNYNQFVFDTFTLSDGDATHDRIDAFVVELTDGTISANQIQLAVIEGTPSASPAFPQIDLTTQSLIGYKTVVSGSTSDGQTVINTIFDENVGSAGTEWDIDVEENIDSAYTINPYSGSLSIQVGNSGGLVGGSVVDTEFTLVSPTRIDYKSSDTLNFAILTDYSTDMSIQIKLIDSFTGEYYLKSLTGSNWNEFGIFPLAAGTIAGYQLAQISLGAFGTTGTVGKYNTVEFKFSNTAVMQIDQIKLQSNISISNSGSTSSLPYRLISGTITQSGSDNPVFTEGYNDSGVEVDFVRLNSSLYEFNVPGVNLVKSKMNIQLGQSSANNSVYATSSDGGILSIHTPGNNDLLDNCLEIKLYI